MFLDQYRDPALEITTENTPADFEREELARIQNNAAIILQTAAVPRRLGGDASDEDLTRDKRRCRRVLHVLGQAMRERSRHQEATWRKPTPEDRIDGASLDWDQWWADYLLYLETRRRFYANWGMNTDNRQWAAWAVTRFDNEIRWMTYAMR